MDLIPDSPWPDIVSKYPELQRDTRQMQTTDGMPIETVMRVSTIFDEQPWANEYSISMELQEWSKQGGPDYKETVLEILVKGIVNTIQTYISAKTKKMVDNILKVNMN